MKKFVKVRTKESREYDAWFRVDVDEVVTDTGVTREYNVVRTPIFSIIIPLDRDGGVYLVNQHRYTIGKESLELPMGHTDGQSTFDAAKRELREETGLAAGKWRYLGIIYEANGICEMPGALFIASNLKKISKPDEGEEEMINGVKKYPLMAIRQMIGEGAIIDSVTISAFAKADYHGLLD